MPQSKTLPQVLIIPPKAVENYTFLSGAVFENLFPSRQKEGEVKMRGLKIKIVRVLVTSFGKSFHTLHFGFCLNDCMKDKTCPTLIFNHFTYHMAN